MTHECMNSDNNSLSHLSLCDIQWQQFRTKLNAYKQRLLQLQEIINVNARAM